MAELFQAEIQKHLVTVRTLQQEVANLNAQLVAERAQGADLADDVGAELTRRVHEMRKRKEQLNKCV